MPAVQRWSFGPSDAEAITQPVLNVLGAESASRFVEGSELVQTWFPQAERLSVPGAGHLLMVQNPTALAQGLNEFFARHPIGDAGRPKPHHRLTLTQGRWHVLPAGPTADGAAARERG
jgi:hypothetical protein